MVFLWMLCTYIRARMVSYMVEPQRVPSVAAEAIHKRKTDRIARPVSWGSVYLALSLGGMYSTTYCIYMCLHAVVGTL